MCRQSPRLITVVTLLVVAMVSRQQCQSAALKQKDADENYNGIGDDPDAYFDVGFASGREYRVRRSSEKNLTNIPERRGDVFAQVSMADFEKLQNDLKDMNTRVVSLERFIHKLSNEECKGSRCVTGSMKYGCDCLLYVNNKLKWEDAARYCEGMTGKLVNIRNEGLQKNIKKFLKAQLGRRGLAKTQVYTGLIYTYRDSRKPAYAGVVGSGLADGWYWHSPTGVSLTLLDHGDFTYWANEHPHPKDDVFKESCMHLDGTNRLHWVSSHCTVAKNFICHFAAVSRERRRHWKNKKNKKKKNKHRHGKRGRDRDGRGRNHDRQGKRSERETETLRDSDGREGGEKERGVAARDRDNNGGG